LSKPVTQAVLLHCKQRWLHLCKTPRTPFQQRRRRNDFGRLAFYRL